MHKAKRPDAGENRLIEPLLSDTHYLGMKLLRRLIWLRHVSAKAPNVRFPPAPGTPSGENGARGMETAWPIRSNTFKRPVPPAMRSGRARCLKRRNSGKGPSRPAPLTE